MVVLTHISARLDWYRANDEETEPAILVLCYLNRVLMPFRPCCKDFFSPEDVHAMTVDASRGRTAPM
eukprot:7600449-Prorocentrum_lima.AAC.1